MKEESTIEIFKILMAAKFMRQGVFAHTGIRGIAWADTAFEDDSNYIGYSFHYMYWGLIIY